MASDGPDGNPLWEPPDAEAFVVLAWVDNVPVETAASEKGRVDEINEYNNMQANNGAVNAQPPTPTATSAPATPSPEAAATATPRPPVAEAATATPQPPVAEATPAPAEPAAQPVQSPAWIIIALIGGALLVAGVVVAALLSKRRDRWYRHV